MKILMVTEYPPEKGAVADYSYHLIEKLVERNVQVDLLSESGQEPEGREIDGVEVIGSIPDVEKWRKMDLMQYDLIHFQYYVEGLREYVKYRLLGGNAPPELITLHDVPTEFKHKILFTVFRNVVLLNEHTEKKFLKAHPVLTRIFDHQVFRAPYLGLDPDLPERVAEKEIETELNEDAINIVCPGFIHEKKQFHKVPPVFDQLAEEYDDLELTFAGGKHRTGSDEYMEKVEKAVDDAKQSDRIRITGVLPTEYHVYQYEKEADIVVLPFEEISQSASLAKTIAMGTNVIVTPLNTLKPVIEKYGGVMTKSKDQSSIKDAIEKVIKDPSGVEADQIRQDISWKSNAAKYGEIYGEIVA